MKIYLTKYYNMCLYTSDILQPCQHPECHISLFIRGMYPHIPNPEHEPIFVQPQEMQEIEGISDIENGEETERRQIWKELIELRRQIEEIERLLTKILEMLRSIGIEVEI